MKSLDERIEDRKQRKLENQGEEAVRADAEKGLALAGVGYEAPFGTSAGVANNGGGGWPGAGEGNDGGSDPLSLSVPALTAHLDSEEDPAAVDALIERETAGQNRSTALAALNARKTALSAA